MLVQYLQDERKMHHICTETRKENIVIRCLELEQQNINQISKLRITVSTRSVHQELSRMLVKFLDPSATNVVVFLVLFLGVGVVIRYSMP